MQLRTFIAKDMREAMAKIRAEMGVEAVIVSSQRAKGGGVMVRAAVEESAADAQMEEVAVAYSARLEAEAVATSGDFAQQYHQGLIRRLRSAPPKQEAAPQRNFNRAELLAILRRHRATDALGHALAEAAEKTGLSDMTLALASALDTRMTTAPIELGRAKALLLTGPHGAGKTAVAAKLAAQAMQAGRKVKLIAGDAKGAGAVERLKTFADHLGVAFAIADSAEALSAAIAECAKDQVLAIIDTAGFDPRNGKARSAFAALAKITGVEALGIVSAAGDAEEMSEIAAALTSLGARRLIVTGSGYRAPPRHAGRRRDDSAVPGPCHAFAVSGGRPRNPYAAVAGARADRRRREPDRAGKPAMTTPILPAPRLTAIGSGKGGTGKTLVAIALAQALAHEGERVLLCDADLGLSNSAVQLGLDRGGDLPALMAGTRTLSQAVVPVLGGADARGGFDLVAAPSGSGALANTGAVAAEDLVAKLRTGREYTRVLIDLGAGVDAAVMRFAAAADETLLVLTPDPASLTDAYAFAKLLLKATGTRLPLALVNMAMSDADARRTEDALAATCSAFLNCVPDFLGSVPRDAQALEAVRRQCPVLTHLPQGAAARALTQIARRLHARQAQTALSARAAGMR